MPKKLVIWLIGGNSVGKTTQARGLHRFFSMYAQYKGQQIIEWEEDGKKMCYTKMNSISANLGNLLGSQCGGTDTLNSKHQIKTSFEAALNDCDVVIVEGIMATGTWIDFLKTPETIVWTILLDVSDEVNLRRLRQRRATKLGRSPSEVEITSKTKENLAGKLRGFRSLYGRMKEYSRYHTRIFTDVLDIIEVRKLLKKGLIKIIDEQY